MALYSQLFPLDRQPQAGDAVRLAPPYARRGGVAVIGREIIAPVMRTRFLSHSGAAQILPGPGGRALSTDGATSSRFDIGKVPKALPGMMWVVQFSTLASGGPDYLSGTVNTGGSYVEDLMVNSADETSSAGSLEMFLRDDAGAIKKCNTGNIGVNDGRVHTVVWAFTGAATGSNGFSCWVDGIQRSLTYTVTDALGTLGTDDTEFPIWLMTRNLRGTGGTGSDATQRIYLYARLPAPAERAESISRNPWQLFEVAEQPFFISAAAPSSFKAAWARNANTVLYPGTRAA